MSLGDVHTGRLDRGVPLPASAPGLVRLGITDKRRTSYGTRELVGLLQRTGARLAQRFPGSEMRVGNLSLPGGGPLTQSHSHRAGRDADIAFFMNGRKGKDASPDAYVRFSKDLKGKRKGRLLRLDRERNWAMIRAILTDRDVQVQHLFVSEPIKVALLGYAREQSEPAWLVERAAWVLSEPGNSGPHNDHLHVRLYCALHEKLEGCVDSGTIWPWVDRYEDRVARRARELMGEVAFADAGARGRAIELLGTLGRVEAVGALVAAAVHDTPHNRGKARAALRRIAQPAAFEPLLMAARELPHPDEAVALVETALASAGPAQLPAILRLGESDLGAWRARLTGDDRSRVRERLAGTVAPWLDESTAPMLAGIMTDPSRRARAAAQRAFEWLANREFVDPQAAAEWWQRHRTESRARWLREGFEREDIDLAAPLGKLVPKLLAVVKYGGARSINARKVLERVTGHRNDTLAFDAERAYRQWARWWMLYRLDIPTVRAQVRIAKHP